MRPTTSTFRNSAAAISSARWSAALAAESLTRVLYPDDSTEVGQALRFVQEYFLVACSLADLVRRFRRGNADWRAASREGRDPAQRHASDDGGAGADADSARRGASRLGRGLGPHAADAGLHQSHACCPKRSRNGRSHWFEALLPRHLEIIFEINRRFLDDVRTRFPGDEARVARMSLIEEGPSARSAWPTWRSSARTAPTVWPRSTRRCCARLTVKDLAEMFPERFNNKTNGVTPRRWLLLANPGARRARSRMRSATAG